MHSNSELIWEIASDANEVHDLLCESDRFNASEIAPSPKRNRETTIKTVSGGLVHILRRGGKATAMFTLTWDPPFDLSQLSFPVALKAAYLSRLAVHPDALAETILGLQCVRRAMEVAEAGAGDTLRCEANPDLQKVWSLLQLMGFKEINITRSTPGSKRAYLYKNLR